MGNTKIIQSILYKTDNESILGIKKLLHFILWKKDKALQSEALQWLEGKLEEVANSDFETQRKQLAIDQLIAIMPYFIGDELSVKIPVLNNGNYQVKQFSCERVPLLPAWWLRGDQYHAFGLTCEGQSPLLLFKGTTYPTDEGFWTTVMADLFPFAKIGWPIMAFGRSRIQYWARDKSKIKAMGQSLGGAMAIWASDIDNVEEVIAVNPALPSAKMQSQAHITVIANKGDIISRIGLMGKDWDVYSVENRDVNNGFYAHLQPWLSQKRVKDPKIIQPKPLLLWAILYWVIRPIAFFVLLPFFILHLLYQGVKWITSLPYQCYSYKKRQEK